MQGRLLVSAAVRLTPSWNNLENKNTCRNTCWLVCMSQEYSPSFGAKRISSPSLLSRPPQKVKCVGKKVPFLINSHRFPPTHLLVRGFLALNPPDTLLKVMGKTAEKGLQGCSLESLGVQHSARVGFSVLYSQLHKCPVNILLNGLSWLQL